MTYHIDTARDYMRILVSTGLIVLGVLILFGIISFPVPSFWLSWVLAIAGLIIASVSAPSTKITGLLILLVGVYLLLRQAEIVSTPLLGYFLGIMLIIIGAVNLGRGARGGGEARVK